MKQYEIKLKIQVDEKKYPEVTYEEIYKVVNNSIHNALENHKNQLEVKHMREHGYELLSEAG